MSELVLVDGVYVLRDTVKKMVPVEEHRDTGLPLWIQRYFPEGTSITWYDLLWLLDSQGIAYTVKAPGSPGRKAKLAEYIVRIFLANKKDRVFRGELLDEVAHKIVAFLAQTSVSTLGARGLNLGDSEPDQGVESAEIVAERGARSPGLEAPGGISGVTMGGVARAMAELDEDPVSFGERLPLDCERTFVE